MMARMLIGLACILGIYAQNVGIGTATPATRLHVAGSNATLTVGPFDIGQAEGRIVATGSSAELSFVRRTLSSWPSTPAAGDRFVWYAPDNTARLWTPAVDLLTVTTAPLVGVRTTAPEGVIDVNTGSTDPQVDASSGALSYGSEKADLVLTRRHSPSKSLNGWVGSLIDFRVTNASGDNWSVAQVIGVADLNDDDGGWAGGLAFLTSPGGNINPAGRRTRGAAPQTRMVIDAFGNVGIGTIDPHLGARLHIDGGGQQGVLFPQVALQDRATWGLIGGPIDGMVVYNTNTSGSGVFAVTPGLYYWQGTLWHRFSTPTHAPMVRGKLPGGTNTINVGTTWQYTGSYITLPPGTWVVYGTFIIRSAPTLNHDMVTWVRTTLGDNTTCSTYPYCSSDVIGSPLISGFAAGPSEYGLVSGQITIHNNTSGNKTYYLLARVQHFGPNPPSNISNFGTGYWHEDQLFAIPVSSYIQTP
ncbi:MAG: hypothetical protein N2200_06655 [Bacteroidia bacterium]|nr:hypothetical protein [Bacteroidia bacterium]